MRWKSFFRVAPPLAFSQDLEASTQDSPLIAASCCKESIQLHRSDFLNQEGAFDEILRRLEDGRSMMQPLKGWILIVALSSTGVVAQHW